MAKENWTPDRAEVERLAYRYWEDRAYSHGHAEEDWYRAEREIRRMRGEPAPRADRTVVGIFHSLSDAHKACEALRNEGYSQDEVSVIANKAGSEIGADVGIGAALGGAGGLMLGFAGLAVPGVGPVLAAGPILTALGGAGMGAAAGGLIGALAERGVPEQDARYYAEGIRRGDILVTVHATSERADRACETMDAQQAVNLNDRVSAWRKRGWTDHDPEAAPLSAEELRREREYYSAAESQASEWSRRTRGVKGGSKAAAAAETATLRKDAGRSSRIYQQA